MNLTTEKTSLVELVTYNLDTHSIFAWGAEYPEKYTTPVKQFLCFVNPPFISLLLPIFYVLVLHNYNVRNPHRCLEVLNFMTLICVYLKELLNTSLEKNGLKSECYSILFNNEKQMICLAAHSDNSLVKYTHTCGRGFNARTGVPDHPTTHVMIITCTLVHQVIPLLII